jgi:hypothetical protein
MGGVTRSPIGESVTPSPLGVRRFENLATQGAPESRAHPLLGTHGIHGLNAGGGKRELLMLREQAGK